MDFFSELDELDFDRLVKKYCTDKLQVRVKRKLKFIGAKVLKKTGTYDFVRSYLRKITNSSR